MIDEKRLEQEYRKLKRQQAPDLWNRIEGKLQEHPERNREILAVETDTDSKKKVFWSEHRIYGMATAAAAMLVLLVAAPKLMEGRFEKSSDEMAPMMAGGAAATEAAPGAGMVTEEPGDDLAASAEAAGNEAEAAGTGMLAEAIPEETMPENAMSGGAMPEAAEPRAGMAMAEKDEEGTEPTMKNSLAMNSGEQNDRGVSADSSEKRILPEGVLSYDQLKLAAYQPVAVPENAVSVGEDSEYFSEDILRDTQLLCGGTVTKVSFEQDSSGKAVKVVYEMTLDRVYFSEDYTTGMETITVKSPIVRTDGDEVYILYQLQMGGTYLLPLHKPEKDWELLYPFAPQIQVTGDGAYLFHSGYTSLMNEETSVVIGRPEGSNDYFYDRMVLRDDKDFLSDLLALIEH